MRLFEELQATAAAEYKALMPKRTQFLVTALQLCLDELQKLKSSDPDVLFAIKCGGKALAHETKLRGAP